MKLDLENTDPIKSVEIDYYKNRIRLLEAQRRLEKQKLLPDISLNYFQGTNSGVDGNLFGYQFGLKIPLLFNGQSSRIKAAKFAENKALAESTEYEIQLNTKYDALKLELAQLQRTLDYYEKEGQSLSEEILKTATSSFRNGEIDSYQYTQSVESAYDMQLTYLDTLNAYNKTIIAINYLTL